MPELSIALLAVLLGVIIWFERALRRDRRAAAQWQTLSKVSAVLGEILHEHTKLEDVLRLLVPTFADWSTLHLLEDGGVRRAAVVHADPELERQLRKRLSEVPFVRDAPLGPAKVLRTGEADLLHHGRAQILAGQLDPALLERAGIGSRISVPLRARQQLIGALTIHRRAVGVYDSADIVWAQELARLIALAIENTRLYADVRRLFDQSASANWVTREDGRIVACNQMFAQLLGFASIDEVMRTPAAKMYADASERKALIDDVKRHGRVIGREATFRRHDNGRPVFVAVHVFGEFDDHGELLKLTG